MLLYVAAFGDHFHDKSWVTEEFVRESFSMQLKAKEQGEVLAQSPDD